MAYKTLILEFVAEVCQGRDPSHGLTHMKDVADLAMIYALSMNLSQEEQDLVWLVAMLHDVADHKYDSNGDLKLKIKICLNHVKSEFDLPEFEIDWLMEIIARISFSREKKEGNSDWHQVLGEKGILIRNIVSDADKYYALGQIGYERCVIFTREHYFLQKQITSGLLRKLVWKHADEKLLRLIPDGYFKTPMGIQNAKLAEKKLKKLLIEMPYVN